MEDVFRKEYKELDQFQKEHMLNVKTKAEELYQALKAADWENTKENTPIKNRCIAVSKTKLEECVMWAVKGITA